MLQHAIWMLLFYVTSGFGRCYDPSPAFPVPAWHENVRQFRPVFAQIEKKLDQFIGDERYENVSFSIEVTTNTETIWQYYHAARRFNETRPGTRSVDSSSQYRIASISKLFTTLALLYQHKAGNLSLDDPVSNYIAELSGPDAGDLPWKDISLRALASQLSGIPRDSFQADLINLSDEPWTRGLPPVSRKGLPSCNNNYEPCSRSDFLGFMKKASPIFAPNQFSTYSNNAFVLLGLVIENVTGMPYEKYIDQTVFQPLNMTMSTMKAPPDEHAVLPADGHSWDVDQAVANPTGGIYSSSSDLSKFLRYVLTHYNTLATGVNWLKPASWAFGMHGFYGMPWEIFRTDRILADGNEDVSGSSSYKRPVTFATKSGGLPGYLSHVLILEEYGLGITILVGSSGTDVFRGLLETVTVGVVRGAERAAWAGVARVYPGTYTAYAEDDETGRAVDSALAASSSPSPSPLPSSWLRIASSPARGVTVEAFVSNGSDALATFAIHEQLLSPPGQTWAFRAQIVPTLLFKNESAQEGEIWRAVAVPEQREHAYIWDDYCIADIDTMAYAGLPLNEIVFWHKQRLVELPAWRLKLRLREEDLSPSGLIVQE